MILKNRLFERREPSREAKSIYIFCEGVKREYQYFQYFKEIDSRINIEVYQLTENDDNSPFGLYNIAVKCIIKTEQNPNPKYELIAGVDETWFVIDTDKWGDRINDLKNNCLSHTDWYVAQSNPCFEVWLYYHFFVALPSFEGIEASANWKPYLDSCVLGGFDSRKHPILVNSAIENSIKNYSESDEMPIIGCTSVFRLAGSIYNLVKDKIIEGLRKTREGQFELILPLK